MLQALQRPFGEGRVLGLGEKLRPQCRETGGRVFIGQGAQPEPKHLVGQRRMKRQD